jgi:hypothetical protein
MNWIDYEYPNTAYIVEVKYSGDIAITTCRCKDMPKPRDNSRGFTRGFWDYAQAAKYARHVAAELAIPAAKQLRR